MFYGFCGVFLLVAAAFWYVDSGFDFRQILMMILGLTMTLAWKDRLKRRARRNRERK